jgi:hypothetical protein
VAIGKIERVGLVARLRCHAGERGKEERRRQNKPRPRHFFVVYGRLNTSCDRLVNYNVHFMLSFFEMSGIFPRKWTAALANPQPSWCAQTKRLQRKAQNWASLLQ